MNNKHKLERKPSIKVKPLPPVRQTLTSYKRLLLANPLLEYEKAGVDIKQLKNTLNNNEQKSQLQREPSAVKPKPKEFIKPKTVPKPNLPKNAAPVKPKEPAVKKNVGNLKTTLIKTNVLKFDRTKEKPSLNSTFISRNKPQPQKKEPPAIVRPSEAAVKRPVQINHVRNASVTISSSRKVPPPVRKSLSAEHFNLKRNKMELVSFKDCIDRNESVSSMMDNISSRNVITTSTPRRRDKSSHKNGDFVFKTPSAYERRSVKTLMTPASTTRTTLSSTGSDQCESNPKSPNSTLQVENKLDKWLRSKGKNVSSFKHLKCFGIHINSIQNPKKFLTPPLEKDNEDKENIENVEQASKSESYDNLLIDPSNEACSSTVDQMPIETDLNKIAKEALIELHKLILEDLPQSQCIKWLELIKEKNSKIEDTPEYWECRAAIEQTAGNVENAIKFYRTAIVQGAEITTVDQSLDNLLEKFSLLNINQPGNGVVTSKPRAKIIEEARNVFKSSIIQFAIQEKKSKKNKENNVLDETGIAQMIVTPVRRSTRLSTSKYGITPGVQLYSSLSTINSEIIFKKNKALC